MMDGVILPEIVGIREKITLALEEAVRGILVVGDVLPEPVLAEIAGVGLLEEVLGAAQPGIPIFFAMAMAVVPSGKVSRTLSAFA